ncbi:MAG: hypothetical protein MSS85_00760 [Pyramidobacter sp.]|nr:hypothetical protein [Pyramidobacter sp.]
MAELLKTPLAFSQSLAVSSPAESQFLFLPFRAGFTTVSMTKKPLFRAFLLQKTLCCPEPRRWLAVRIENVPFLFRRMFRKNSAENFYFNFK